jgi:hypothetical protein
MAGNGVAQGSAHGKINDFTPLTSYLDDLTDPLNSFNEILAAGSFAIDSDCVECVLSALLEQLAVNLEAVVQGVESEHGPQEVRKLREPDIQIRRRQPQTPPDATRREGR